MKTYVLYHAGCADGFGAAWAAWFALGDAAIYRPVSHGNPPPPMDDGSDVYIVDFSYPRPVLDELAQRMRGVLIIDHHATAKAELEGIPWARFDTSKSGAVATWEYFFSDKPVPQLLLYVQDRDLWQWLLPESREVSAALATYPFEFPVWTELAQAIDRLKAEGRTALRVVQVEAERKAAAAWFKDIGGHRVPVVNATTYVSEVCHEMLALYPEAPFVVAYREKDGVREWSLRSRRNFDCSAIAKQYGGGGHPQAAGFAQQVSVGLEEIILERLAQPSHGYSPEHDDQHGNGELALAAGCYAIATLECRWEGGPTQVRDELWPFEPETFRYSGNRRKALAKAGSLCAAEIDRIDRLQKGTRPA